MSRGRASAGAVQRVEELGFSPGAGPEAEVGPPGLVVGEDRATGHLQPLLHPRRPDLQVVRHGTGEPQVPGCQEDHPVGEAQALKDQLSASPVSSSSASRLRSGVSYRTNSTLSNWWTRSRPRVSFPAAPASRRKQGE